MYTDDKNARIILSLLKQYGIRKIVVSPGTTNVPISLTVQNDSWFEVYSVVDERSAAYFATGLAYESGEPVVISCTGATASRNYLSGMTEAYYRNLPIVALTSQHHVSDYRNLVPQVTDRRVSQNDAKKVSVMLPSIKDTEDVETCEILANDALIKLTSRGGGPVHINLPVDPTYPFSEGIIDSEDAHMIDYYDTDRLLDDKGSLLQELRGKKVGIFIGSHSKFNGKLQESMGNFVNSHNTVVFVDHTSNYHGKNKVLTGQVFDLLGSGNKPDILIDMGGITGDYSTAGLGDGIEVWRISEDGEMHKRYREGGLDKLFDCSEAMFFRVLTGKTKSKQVYYSEMNLELAKIARVDMPLSGTYIAEQTAKLIPRNSSLHLGILNSLRNMNLFSLDDSVTVISNVGGFGIDGPVSTLIGQSMFNKDRLYFSLVGDLAFFYDMNIIGNRHVGKNIRILLINNGLGAEFRLNLTNEDKLGDAMNSLVAAEGHNGSAKAWVESMGFEYLSASSKEEFANEARNFFSKNLDEFDKPVLFEVFTTVADEQSGFDLIRMQ